jgi:hypothetical protein
MKVSIKVRHPSRLDWIRKNYIYLLGILALVLSAIITSLVFAHFQLGLDLWLVKIEHPETAQYWGQIGDFVGGILNPILSFCALIAVLYNLSLQREELALARKDARDAQSIQTKQSEIFERQNFESVFFRLLEAHSRLSTNMEITVAHATKQHYSGEEAFRYIAKRYLRRDYLMSQQYISSEEQIKNVTLKSQEFLDAHVGSVGHYFRNLYQILKYVDGFGRTSFSSSSKSHLGMEMRRTVRLYRAQRDYANILRAQLSSSEVACLFLNCLSEQGRGLKFYVEKYSMLKTLDPRSIGSNESVKALYNPLAYADFEEMDMKDIIDLVRDKYEERDRGRKPFRMEVEEE